MIKTSVATNAKMQKCKCRIEIALMVYTSMMSFLAVNFLIWVGGERVPPFGVQVFITMQLSLLSNNAFLIGIKD